MQWVVVEIICLSTVGDNYYEQTVKKKLLFLSLWRDCFQLQWKLLFELEGWLEVGLLSSSIFMSSGQSPLKSPQRGEDTLSLSIKNKKYLVFLGKIKTYSLILDL